MAGARGGNGRYRRIIQTALVAARTRYDGGPALDLGQTARPVPSANVRTAVGSVEDPWPNPERDPFLPRERVRVTINRLTDLLEREYAHKRITDAAYLIGRVLQEVFERRSGPRAAGSPEGRDRVDQSVAHELAMVLAIDDGRLVEALKARLAQSVGSYGARFLHQVLAEGREFAEISRGLGRGDSRAAVAFVAEHFRTLLEQVAVDLLEEQTFRGPERGQLRGTPAAPAAPGECVDEAGCLTTPTRAYRVAEDRDGSRRWQPAWKRRALGNRSDKPVKL
ncbi:hypothetical protein [Methylobacterium isbiliense]|uniref:Uncharacterized protein n=1 Tax=Methylobacterium isbiliense TaxID=315478 RepID=A0ABQ4SM21_9HYPH|nr:hypothetical protein [Methylobacterium isbiliense]MDN3627156.1 hypothetical protein [Methylobacterium isbiliense]GJE03589.1 hypothetical protein GMJLKIPL_5546 [Methylobacterium isbiliense]